MDVRTSFRVAAAVAAATFALAGCATSTSKSSASTNAQGFPDTITLAAVPSENSADLKASFDPIIKLLEQETGSKVEFKQASDYAGVVEGVIAKNVDLAFFGPFPYVVAGIKGAHLTPVGAVIKDAGTPPGYQSYGLTKADNASINGLKDFAGKTVCFVDPSSTSGFLYPSAGLIEAGVVKNGSESAIADGVTPIYAGAHDASALAIANGDCEAGFAYDTMVDKTMIEKGDLKPGQLKTVWKSEMIAGSVFAANETLSPEATAKIADILETKANLPELQQAGICTGDACRFTDERSYAVVEAADSDYDGVRKVCEVTGSKKCKA